MDLGLKGKCVIITGGTKGIGRSAANIFADESAHVAICARNKDEVAETVSALTKKGVTAYGEVVDMMHTVNTVNAAMPHLEKSKAGAIVTLSSVSGREVDFTGHAYGAFKAAIIHYSQTMAYKLAGKNIRVNSVSPGNTYFDGGVWQMIEKNLPDLFKTAMSMNPTGRMATITTARQATRCMKNPGAITPGFGLKTCELRE